MGRHEGTNVFLGRGGAVGPRTRTPLALVAPWMRRESLYRCLVQSASLTETKKRSQRRTSRPVDRRFRSRPVQGRTTEVSLLDRRGPDRCYPACPPPS